MDPILPGGARSGEGPRLGAAHAEAKINLSLDVLGRRPDGFHELRGLMARIGLSDRLVLRRSAADDSVREEPPLDQKDPGGCGRDGRGPTAPFPDSLECRNGLDPPFRDKLRENEGFGGANNLVLRAIRAFRELTGYPDFPVTAHLFKRIPLAAGLGGGSSDAAAALSILRGSLARRAGSPAGGGAGAAGSPPSPEAMNALAASLGGDVPFFLERSPVCWAGGIGERLSSFLGALPGDGLVLLNPGTGLSTAAVFASLGLTTGAGFSIKLFAEIRDAVSREGLFLGRNGLEAAALGLCPALAEARAILAATRPAPVCLGLSGSGPTFWALHRDMGEAGRALLSVSVPPGWWARCVPLIAGRF